MRFVSENDTCYNQCTMKIYSINIHYPCFFINKYSDIYQWKSQQKNKGDLQPKSKNTCLQLVEVHEEMNRNLGINKQSHSLGWIPKEIRDYLQRITPQLFFLYLLAPKNTSWIGTEEKRDWRIAKRNEW